MSEYANKKTRGTFIAAVFAMQGVGIVTSGVVALLLASSFENEYKPPTFAQDPIRSLTPEADYIWRVLLMFGAIPAALTYYYRMQMPETARYTALVAKNATQAAADMSRVLNTDIEAEELKLEKITGNKKGQFSLFTKQFAQQYGLRLLGTTSTWFLLDIAFYSQNLFQKDIFTSVGWIPAAKEMSAIREVWKVARAQTLIALCGTVPGYWFTVAFIDVIGRRIIQLMGFLMMTIFMFAIAYPYEYWKMKEHRAGFIIMYGLTFFFANFGPNATTFVVPAEIFPARMRSTCHGISAAAGKAGAIVGAFGFLYLSQEKDITKRDHGYPAGIGKRNSLFLLGVLNFIGMLFTFFVPESMGLSLEEAANEVEIEVDEEDSRNNFIHI